MELTTAEKRVYTTVGPFLAGILATAILGISYSVLWLLIFLVPVAFAVVLTASLWRGTRR